MSMKRSRQKSYGASWRGSNDDATPVSLSKPSAPEKSWEEQTAGQPDQAFVPYALKSRFAKGTLLVHPTFGKGVVVGADDSRIEVLFQDGKKKLGHGVG